MADPLSDTPPSEHALRKCGSAEGLRTTIEFCLQHSAVICDENTDRQRQELEERLEAIVRAVSKRVV
jgi:hypothetical protein